jgi:hypothetical protein
MLEVTAETKIVKIVYKGAVLHNGTPCIVALGIPEDAHAVVPKTTKTDDDMFWNKKRRANKVITLAIAPIVRNFKNRITVLLPKLRHQSAVALFSYAYGHYEYLVGRLQEPEKKFDPRLTMTCTSGIHFFESIELAALYAVFDGNSVGYNMVVKDTERFITFAEEQAERYNNKKPLS